MKNFSEVRLSRLATIITMGQELEKDEPQNEELLKELKTLAEKEIKCIENLLNLPFYTFKK